jgi:hypothetical protein
LAPLGCKVAISNRRDSSTIIHLPLNPVKGFGRIESNSCTIII